MISLFLAISMALDSYIACVSPIYYRKKFRLEDSRIIVGLFWVLCFVISIWPFRNSVENTLLIFIVLTRKTILSVWKRHTRWQCHIYYALSSPLVINIDPHIWANMNQFDRLPLLFYFCFGLLIILIFPVFMRNRRKQHVKISSMFLLSVFILERTRLKRGYVKFW